MFFVAGVDALGTVATKKILVELEAAGALELGHTNFLGGSRKDRGFIDHHVTPLQGRTYGLTGLNEGCQVGPVGLVHRSGYGDDKNLACLQILQLVAVAQVTGRP